MKDQEFEASGTKYQVLPNFESVAGSYGGSKLRVFAHACAVSALSKCITSDLKLKRVFLSCDSL